MTTSSPVPVRSRWLAALSGLLAAVAGLAAGELVAAPVRHWPAPVLAIGDRVVQFVPQPVKAFAIDVFGTNDKIALITGILVLLALAATGLGALSRTRRRLALVLTGGFGLLGAVAAAADTALPLTAAVPSIVAGVVAVGVLASLTRRRVAGAGTGDRHAGRRGLLRDLGYVTAGIAVVGGGGRLWSRALARQAAAARDAVGLPPPVEPVTIPPELPLEIDGLAPFQTPNAEFYRIDTRLDTPRLQRDGWTLRVHGMVGGERSLTLPELESEFEVIERAITLTCVSNEIGGDLVGTATWRGVRVADVLDSVGVEPAATQLVGRAFDGFTTGYPVDNAYDRDAMLVVGMNGEPLPAAHGFPLRMVVPGLYGYVSATKWLTELELTTFDAFDQYWVARDWEPRAPIKTMSRIDTPGSLERVAAGTTVPVAGVAWAQTRGIEKVEVRIDGGPWVEADLAPAFNDVTWRQWVFPWDTSGIDRGRHDIQCRATDGTGATQTMQRQPPFPDGATGWHGIAVLVE